MNPVHHEDCVPKHIVPAFTQGETCKCGKPATHKLAEVLPSPLDGELKDDGESYIFIQNRHEFNIYLCCDCFCEIIPQARRSCGV